MPDVTLNITIPEVHVTRVQTALGVSNKTQAENWVKKRIKDEVIAFEAQQVRATEQAKVEQAEADKLEAVAAAADAAESEITL